MQIKSVFISNMLSFPFTEDRTKAVRFYTDKNDAPNILIGPNGSGKTNFLKIVKQLITYGIVEDMVYVNNPESINQTIYWNKMIQTSIKAHFATPDKASFARIEIKVTETDKENLIFIQENREIGNRIIETYSTIGYIIPELSIKDIKKVNSIHINFDVNTKLQTIIATYDGNNHIEKFIFDMLKYQELSQLCITIFNEKMRMEGEDARYSLKNTFSYLDSTRNFDKIRDNTLSHKAREHYVGKKNGTSSNFPGYALCVRKVRNILNYKSTENNKKAIYDLSLEEIEEKLHESIFFTKLHTSIKKYLNLELKTIYHGDNIELIFIDEDNIAHSIHDISQGEQSLLIILMSIYGHDLKDGILIIDEPEMHFHPQIQRRLSKMLEKLSKEIGTQCIISTYSPMFINEHNIKNVYRFNKKNGETIIKCPDRSIAEDESSLIQILKFENAAKIFFVDTIIMVEGEIDAYFFEYYLEYLHKFPERKDYLKNYEIININGKGSYRKRYKFLKKFNIESYFIGDWDNIVDYGFVQQSDLSHYYKEARSYYARKGKGVEGRYYTKLVTTVRDLHPSKYEIIINNIKSLYKNNVFILQRGDIETYLGMKAKGLEETINFCRNFFDARLKNPELIDHRNELERIIGMIFKKNYHIEEITRNNQEKKLIIEPINIKNKKEETIPLTKKINKKSGENNILIGHRKY